MVAAAFSFNLKDTNNGYNDELAVAQDDDPRWKTAKETIRRGKKAGAFRLLGNRLYRQSVVGNKLLQRLCLPAKYRIEVLRRYHDELTSAHLGLNRCLHQIKKRFYWPRMARFVQNYIRACQLSGSKGSSRQAIWIIAMHPCSAPLSASWHGPTRAIPTLKKRKSADRRGYRLPDKVGRGQSNALGNSHRCCRLFRRTDLFT